ncbi:PAS domain-containing sensor histidine kinase [Salipaludibacillus daqingensis]|uniref:PAS domain-containing sensor histidine kinase n=1 Tax=Salipaludibacillus daqingensis TaxID=3041001 RepID=UPI0024758E44|nr:PAS domain-containing sensor histidine kinase [Salipaludibacillus daqingensis]
MRRRHAFQSIRYKVLFFGLMMSIIPLLLISVYYLLEMSGYVEESAESSQELRVENFAQTIRNNIDQTFQRMEMIGSMSDLTGQASVFYDLLKQQESIDEIVLLDEQGDVQERISRYELNDLEPDQDEWLADSLKEQQLESEGHFFSDVRFNEYGQPYIQLVVETSGETAYQIGVSLQLQKLIGNVSSYQMENESAIYLRDQHGQIIAHQDYANLWQQSDRENVDDMDGMMMLRSPIDEVEWELVLEQSRREMLAPIYDMLRSGTFTASLMILFGSVLSIYAGLYFVKPIEKLQSGMKHVKYGYWPEKMEVDRNDEFGELTMAFNEMTTEIQEKERRLKQEKERLDIVVNSMDAGLAVVKKDYSIAWMNPTLQNWIGSRTNIPCFQLFNDDKESPCYACPLNEATSFEKMDELLTKTGKDGELRTYRHRVFPLQYALEDDEEVLIVMEDITEEKKMEEKLIQTDKLSALGLMASSFAHEVNNPLASVQVYAEDLMDRLEEDKSELLESGDMDHYLQIIRKNINRCKEITTNLLNFSRKSPWKTEEFSIDTVLNESLMLMEHSLKKQRVSVSIHKQEIMPVMKGDPLKISQVFVNLIQNAMDALSQQESPTLDIFLKRDAEYVTVSFQDNGIGISESNIQKLFDPFFTSKPTGKGTGLGLSVCYGIVKQMRGTMEVESQLDVGSTFKVMLPVELSTENVDEGEGESR